MPGLYVCVREMYILFCKLYYRCIIELLCVATHCILTSQKYLTTDVLLLPISQLKVMLNLRTTKYSTLSKFGHTNRWWLVRCGLGCKLG